MSEIDRKLLEVLVCPQTREALLQDAEKREFVSPKARLAYPVADDVPHLTFEHARELGADE